MRIAWKGFLLLLPVLFYGGIFFQLLRKKDYRKLWHEKGKRILVETLLFAGILSIGLLFYFKAEDTIYSYDYAGHWLRSLRLKEVFHHDPYQLPAYLYRSALSGDYSSLPAYLSLPVTLLHSSYGFFALSNLWVYVLPFFVLLQLYYHRHYEGKLPVVLLLSLVFYPLYFTLFFGEVDMGGLFFLGVMYLLILFQKEEEISRLDLGLTNVLALVLILFRRWYLYPLLVFYLLVVLRYLFRYFRCLGSRESLRAFWQILQTGIYALLVLLIFFRELVIRVLFYNYEEAYAFYNRSGKFLSLVNYLSPLFILLGAIGIYSWYRRKKEQLPYVIIGIVLPLVLFWRIQSMEYHHYGILLHVYTVLLVEGAVFLWAHKKVLTGFGVLACIQLFLLFGSDRLLPGFTSLRKRPAVLSYKQEVVDLSSYLQTLMTEEWQSAYLASGSTVLNDDMIRNALLPDLAVPNIDSANLDLRDGFPKDFANIQFLIVLDPVQYIHPEYQHIFRIITEAVQKEPLIRQAYERINVLKVDDISVEIYERTQQITPEMKRYFYDKLLEVYPDKGKFFSYILE